MTPDQIELQMASLETWVVELTRDIRSTIKQQFPELTECYKWNCIMWEQGETLVAAIVPLKKSLKVSFFNLPQTFSDLPIQRWSTTATSQNLVYKAPESFHSKKLLSLLRMGIAT